MSTALPYCAPGSESASDDVQTGLCPSGCGRIVNVHRLLGPQCPQCGNLDGGEEADRNIDACAVCGLLRAGGRCLNRECPSFVPFGADTHPTLLRLSETIGLREFLALEIPPPRYVVDGLLEEQDLLGIHGWRGTGKSAAACELALALSTCRGFLRWGIRRPSGCLYVDGEMQAGKLQRRWGMLTAHADELLAPLRFRLSLYHRQEDGRRGLPSLATREGQAVIEAALEEPESQEVRVVVLDSVATLCRVNGASENSEESWQPVQDWLLQLRGAGYAVVVIYHTGKSGLQRGTSSREDVLDTVLHLRRPKDYRAAEGARFEVHIEKGREIYGPDAEPFEARLVAGPDGGSAWTWKPIEGRAEEVLEALLLDGVPPDAAWQEAGLSRATAYRTRKRLVGEGKLQPSRAARRS